MIAEKVPAEMMEYFEQNRRFCEWYVEVAWQRLCEEMKTEQLRQHWSRFGILEKPKIERIDVHDGWDDWRGVRSVYLTRSTSMFMGLAHVVESLLGGQFGDARSALGSLPRRTSIVSRRW